MLALKPKHWKIPHQQFPTVFMWRQLWWPSKYGLFHISIRVECDKGTQAYMSVKTPEIRWFACQVSRSLHKWREWRNTIANEVVGLYENCPVNWRQPRISMEHLDLHTTTTTLIPSLQPYCLEYKSTTDQL